MDKNKEVLVSVIIPAYNAEAYIAETIESVMAQTYGNWELLIVDDGSTDHTAPIVETYIDPRIVLIRQQNKGMGQARNTALLHAKGTLVAFIDADDCWEKDKLEKQVTLLSDSQVGLTFSAGNYFGDLDLPLNIPLIDMMGSVYLPFLLKKNIIPLPSVMMRMELLSNLGGFLTEKNLGIVADYHLWLRVCKADIRIISSPNERLFRYRIHVGQSTYSDKQLETTLAVCTMMETLKNNKTLTMDQYHSGCQSHIRMLLDHKLRIASHGELETLFCALKKFTFMSFKINLIKRVSKLSPNLAHKISWRLLKS